MKVIELLNKIANGEAPKNIKYNDTDYYLYDKKSYLTNDKSRFFDSIYFKELNDEVEIIKEDKKIEEINEIEYYHQYDECWVKDKFYKDQKGNLVDEIIIDKVNEIIDYINKEDK